MDRSRERVEEIRRTSSEVENRAIDDLFAGRVSRRDFMRRAAVLGMSASLAGFLAACSNGGGGTSAADGERTVVRFAFAPDPVIDWLNDKGIIPKYEDAYGTRLVTTSTWDEFSFFAGGQGDIVSMATYETPLLEDQTGIKTVTFGGYNMLRVPVYVLTETPYQTLEDLKGKVVAVPGPLSSTIVWGMFAKDWYGLDFCIERPDGSDCGDFDLREGDHFANMDLLIRGDVDAGVIIPEAAYPYLRTGKVRALYDPTSAPWQLFEQKYAPGHKGINGNNFTARKDWFDANPNAVQFFLALWERGIKEWRANQAEIIKTYPQYFSVENPADIAYAIEWFKTYDFFVPTVYLDEQWVKDELIVYDLMKKTGWMDPNASIPEFAVTAPTPPPTPVES